MAENCDRVNQEKAAISDDEDVELNDGGVRFQQRRRRNQQSHHHHSIRPLINSQLLQSHPQHRLSRASLLSSWKSMDFGYADERYTL